MDICEFTAQCEHGMPHNSRSQQSESLESDKRSLTFSNMNKAIPSIEATCDVCSVSVLFCVKLTYFEFTGHMCFDQKFISKNNYFLAPIILVPTALHSETIRRRVVAKRSLRSLNLPFVTANVGTFRAKVAWLFPNPPDTLFNDMIVFYIPVRDTKM